MEYPVAGGVFPVTKGRNFYPADTVLLATPDSSGNGVSRRYNTAALVCGISCKILPMYKDG